MNHADGQTIIVTGALGGIGSDTTRLLLDRGSAVIGIDKEPDNQEIFPHGKYRHLTADITNENSMQKACEQILAPAAPSHAILVAGGALAEEIDYENPLSLSLDIFRRSIDLNLSGQYICIKHFAPLLEFIPSLETAEIPDRSITLVSSINSLGDFGYPAYSAAKAGLEGLTKSLAVPLGRRGIRINAVAFGTVKTRHAEELHATDADHFGRLNKLAALQRVSNSAEAARVLISMTQLSNLTGTVITADCGQAVPGNHNR